MRIGFLRLVACGVLWGACSSGGGQGEARESDPHGILESDAAPQGLPDASAGDGDGDGDEPDATAPVPQADAGAWWTRDASLREPDANSAAADAGTPVPTDAGQPEGDAGQPPPPRSVRFSLLSYNVQARPLLDDPRASVNLPIIGSLLEPYDLAGVEECFSQCEKLLDSAPQPHEYYFSEREHWWSLANSGLAGLSQHPIGEVVTAYYQHEAELADTVASKGVALMRVVIEGFAVDVYNTHMQAGDSQAAHDAQAAQADELIAFIKAHSPASHTVLLHGDFNMSPARPNKAFADFAPNHYSSDADMRARTANFQKIIDQLGLRDVSDQLFGPLHDHIDRVLYRGAEGVSVTPLSWRDDGARFVDASGAALSDSMPLVVELELTEQEHH